MLTSAGDELQKNKTMRISIAEGSFGVLSGILADNYTIPFALSLNSSPFQVGILTSMGNLLSPLGQIFGSRKIENSSRKSTLLKGIMGQALIWPIFLLIAILFQLLFFQSLLTWAFLGFYLLYMFFGGLMTPSWFSLMGDIVPENSRGRYFAKRNLITSGIALTGTLLLSFSLDWFKSQSFLVLGFMIIFICGFITRIFSAALFTKHYYPPYEIQPVDHTKFSTFLKQIPKSNFGNFTLFVSLITFGQWIAAPFFSVYMLNVLGFDYSIFIFINLFPSIVALFIFPLLGKLGDKFGNVRLLQLGAIIVPFLPLMWLFLNNPLGILLGPQLISGVGWTSFNLATSNFIYDNIESKKRGQYIAFYNLLVGLSVISGGLFGSVILTFIPITFMNSYHFVFFLSGITRIAILVVLLPKIKEVRVTTKPIFNRKNTSIHNWLFDLTVRDSSKHKKKVDNNHAL